MFNLVHRRLADSTGHLDLDQAAPIGFLSTMHAVIRGLGSSEAALRLVPLFAGIALLAVALLLDAPAPRRPQWSARRRTSGVRTAADLLLVGGQAVLVGCPRRRRHPAGRLCRTRAPLPGDGVRRLDQRSESFPGFRFPLLSCWSEWGSSWLSRPSGGRAVRGSPDSSSWVGRGSPPWACSGPCRPGPWVTTQTSTSIGKRASCRSRLATAPG